MKCKFLFIISVCVLLLVNCSNKVQNKTLEPEIPQVKAVPDSMVSVIDTSFYKKYTDAGGISIISSAKVADEALIRAGKIILHLLSKRKDIFDMMVSSKSKVMIIGVNEEVCDLPEYAWFCVGEKREYWNKRARGFGGSPEDDCSASCGEENLLCLPGDRYEGENILIHEFAHLIHLAGIAKVDPAFNDKLEKLYNQAKEKGLWKNTYTMENKEEYFAETVQSFFNSNRYADPANGVHNTINRREKLKSYDPDMYKLLLEYFPDDDESYICNEIHE